VPLGPVAVRNLAPFLCSEPKRLLNPLHSAAVLTQRHSSEFGLSAHSIAVAPLFFILASGIFAFVIFMRAIMLDV